MFITEKGMNNSSAKLYPIDTVLVAMYGATAAQVGILKFEATSNQAVCGILPHKDYVPEFVYYWFTYIQADLAAQAQGGAQPNISQMKIKNVTIPVVTLQAQRRIVARLDAFSSKVRQLEDNQRKVVAECAALKQAILREVFE
jgi:type I restriction enzyme S subunit